jgi:hypothetical protein
MTKRSDKASFVFHEEGVAPASNAGRDIYPIHAFGDVFKERLARVFEPFQPTALLR